MQSYQIVGTLTRNWWMWLIRGLAAVIFGILLFIWPFAVGAITAFVIAILFAAYALVDGVFAIYATIRAAETHQRWWPFLIEGIAGLLIAAIAFYDTRLYVAIAIFAIFYTIAAWAIITGVFEIVAAVHLRRHIANEVWLIVGGIASILFGILMVIFPLAGALALTLLIAAYAIVFGIIMIGFSLRLRGHVHAPTSAPST
jgi:uncharacterized membrane protein HdeD (DUF308 family)